MLQTYFFSFERQWTRFNLANFRKITIINVPHLLYLSGHSVIDRERTLQLYHVIYAGLSSLGVPGVPWHTQILANQLTLFQPGGQIMPT